MTICKCLKMINTTFSRLNTSRAQSFVWMLEECKDIDYDIEVYKRGKDMLAPSTLKQVHPLGKSPLVTVKTSTMTSPLVIAESGNIMEYITGYFAPHLIPKRYQEGKEGQIGGETETWLRYRHFMHYAEGSLMSLLIISFFMDRKYTLDHGPSPLANQKRAEIRNAPAPFFIKPIVKAIPNRIDSMFLNEQFKTHFSFLESQLATSPDDGKYLCGKDLTGADILISFPLFAGRSRIDKAAYPKVHAYIDLLENHEGYKRSVTKIKELTGEDPMSRL